MRFNVLLFLLFVFVSFYAVSDKVIIAHRGASGYLPEHTLAGYAMAYALGADYLEPDLAMTKDHVLICLHDLTLEATTNVVDVFPNRHREDGKYYAADFTFEEIRQLKVKERFPKRFPRETLLFAIPTLEELIQLVQGLNASTGRNVGIYPELKETDFYKDAHMPFSETLLGLLNRYGYNSSDSNCFIQCFSATELKRLKEEFGVKIPLIQLIADTAMLEQLDLSSIAQYARGIGPNKKCLEEDPSLVERAHAAGLLVHPYTFRADLVPGKYTSIEEELTVFLFRYGVDGCFIDHPDRMKRVLEGLNLSPTE